MNAPSIDLRKILSNLAPASPPTAEVVAVRLDKIELYTRGAFRTRASHSDEAIAAYAERMRAGDKFPPPVVFYDRVADRYYVGDGFHRLAASRQIGLAEVACEVRGAAASAMLEAEKFACGANKTHGVRRTSADKRLAVRVALAHPELGTWSSRAIAEHVGVSDSLVGDVRAELGGEQAARVGRDGKEQAATKVKPARIPTPVRLVERAWREYLYKIPAKHVPEAIVALEEVIARMRAIAEANGVSVVASK